MSIITKPSSISKNVAASFSLSKSELAAVASVVADSNFSDSANWKKVFLNYKSSPGNQHRFVRFDATVENPTGDFLCSLKSKDIFELESIVIKDFDNGSLVIPANELTASEFKINMGTVAPPVSGFDWNVFFGQTTSNGGGELHTTGFGWGEAAYSSTPLVGDFSVTGTFHSVLGGGTNLMIGYKKDLPASAGGASSNISSAIYVDGGIGSITGWNGSDGGASTTSSYLSNATADFSFEISRVGSVITGSVNGSMMFTDTNYSAPVYLASMIYSNNGYGIISTTLNDPVAPAPSILAGAYTVGSNPMQNLTSRSPAEGQSFVLSSSASVTSVKVMISKYSNPSNLPLTGTLNMTLKASDYSGNGAEVVSSNTLDLSTLATAQPTLDGGVICEFLFDTPVSLPSGTNSIKYNYAGLNVDGSTFIQVWGYSPSIGDGLAYSYGGQIAHVDFWFQILGN
jgi:hypothetical protein